MRQERERERIERDSVRSYWGIEGKRAFSGGGKQDKWCNYKSGRRYSGREKEFRRKFCVNDLM
jgi:hypothetical protein